MVNFIKNEARDKAEEIEAKAQEDFNIEKLRLVQTQKEKVRQDYKKKAKEMQIQRTIKKSTAINKARLMKMQKRQSIIDEVSNEANNELLRYTADKTKYKLLLIELAFQACIELQEEKVYIRCRKEDVDMVSSGLSDITEKCRAFILEHTGVHAKFNLQIDDKNLLHSGPSKHNLGKVCLGGVMVTSLDRKLLVDNTLDFRLKCVIEECLPEVKQLLFK